MGPYEKTLLIVTVLVLALLTWSMDAGAQPFGMGASRQDLKKQSGVLNSLQGRFVFGQISDSGKDKFMLDTFTGRLWRISETGEVGLFLSPVPYRTSEGTYSPVPEKAPDPSSRKKGKER
jgi:hypothetical protein